MNFASRKHAEVTDQIRTVLEAKGLTLHRVSEESARLYGRSSFGFIPHNLYHSLRSTRFRPSLQQLCTLSKISGCRLYDWLTLFGFDPGRIPELQARLPRKRTILLDTSSEFRDPWLAWPRESYSARSAVGLVPLEQKLSYTRERENRILPTRKEQRFLYAKIGLEDALAFPDLLPGSVVRIDPQLRSDKTLLASGKNPEDIYLIEHSRGFWCCRLHFAGNDKIVPRSEQIPYAGIDFPIAGQARILGVVDTEFRNIGGPLLPKLLPQQPTHRASRAEMEAPIGELLRQARMRTGMSFREASTMSRSIADLLEDQHYLAAAGSLSDYEVLSSPPRHVEKIITLCVVYGLPFISFVESSGIALEDLGNESMPEWNSKITEENISKGKNAVNFLENRLNELPLFLDKSASEQPSLRDCYWVEDGLETGDPYLKEALVLIIDRRRKALPKKTGPLWQQPFHVLTKRDGSYLCGHCRQMDGKLFLHRESEQMIVRQTDAEVVGQVIMIVRKLR